MNTCNIANQKATSERRDGYLGEIRMHFISDERGAEGCSIVSKVCLASDVEATSKSSLKLEGKNIEHSSRRAYARAARN